MFVTIYDTVDIDRDQRLVRRDGQSVHLTGLEYGLLDFLSAHPNRICSRRELLDHVWGKQFRYDTGTIDVHLNALRRKLSWTTRRPIEAIRGVGFIFRTEEQVSRYTIDLSESLSTWLRSHEPEILAAGLVPQLRLTPFVNEITISPDALMHMLDAILTALLPTARSGAPLILRSRLTMTHFTLSLEISDTVSELRIPIYRDL